MKLILSFALLTTSSLTWAAGEQCRRDWDCRASEWCSMGVCTGAAATTPTTPSSDGWMCRQDWDCGQGEICSNGYCSSSGSGSSSGSSDGGDTPIFGG